jgi:RNA polymerase sigma-70 factor (ECF subfamily)
MGSRHRFAGASARPIVDLMDQTVITRPVPIDTVGCRPGGCAGLCTEEGLRAADAAYRANLLARARGVVVDPALAEEAVQEALLRAWRSCSSFDPDTGPLLPWLLALTRNVAIDLARWRSRRPPVVAAADPAEPPTQPTGIAAEDLVLLRDELVEALAELRPTHRSAIIETVLRDRPHAEVAAELGIPAGTVRSRVHYALQCLRERLDAGSVCACCP